MVSGKLVIAMSLVTGVFYVPIKSATAGVQAFAVDNTETLYSVDLTTATATPIGFTGQFLQGLALSPQGALFATDYLGSLYSVNRTTGAATFIGSTGLGDIEGLTFRGATLIGANFSNLGGATTVYSINTTTAAPTAITSFQQGPVRAMAVLPTNTNAIDVASDSPVSQSLVQVNLLTGLSTTLGQLPSMGMSLTGADPIAALNFGPGGVLYALDPLGNEFTIASNGAGFLVGNTGGQYWLDLADPPTASPDTPIANPEPSSMALLSALGLIGIRAWRKRSGNATVS
jgi:hypothetical protein